MIVDSSTPVVTAQKPMWNTPEFNEVSIVGVTESYDDFPGIDALAEDANRGS